MNRLDLLSDELNLYIFDIRNLKIERNVKMIQRLWRQYWEKMCTLIEITEKCYYKTVHYPWEPVIFLELSRDKAQII